jgi:hypothetical protein
VQRGGNEMVLEAQHRGLVVGLLTASACSVPIAGHASSVARPGLRTLAIRPMDVWSLDCIMDLNAIYASGRLVKGFNNGSHMYSSSR